MIMPASLLFFSVLLDFIFADPQYKYHPVRIIGTIILFLETILRRIGLNGFIGGTLLLFFSLIIVLTIVVILYFIFVQFLFPLIFLLLLFLLYSAIGFRSLILYSKEIASHLKGNDLESAKKTLSNIVGRDVANLNQTEIIRATIESVSENFVDGILSPIFWFVIGSIIGNYIELQLLLGITFVYIYRVTNTLDSMVGYRNERYEQFGKASAKFDDVLNFIPARLSIIVISISSLVIGLDAKNSLGIALRDRLKHKSPNAAHSESAVAGALNIKLGGPVKYSFGIVKKKWLGEEFNDAKTNDLINSNRLINISAIIATISGVIFLYIFL